MRRHPALQDLSRDHHFALRHCQAIRKMAERTADAASPQRVRQAALLYWEMEGRAHFQEEEEIVCPLAQSCGAGGHVSRINAEHAAIRSGFAELEQAGSDETETRAALTNLGRILSQHIRFEEDTFFEAIQTHASDEQLGKTRKVSRAWRTERRGPGSVGPRDTQCPAP